MTIYELATLRKAIAIALYALAHVEARFKSEDTEMLGKALEEMRGIVDAWLKALPYEPDVRNQRTENSENVRN